MRAPEHGKNHGKAGTSEAFITAMVDYSGVQIQRHTCNEQSCAETVQLKIFKYPYYFIHPLHSEDRLGNPEIDFPIGAVFGDSDFFGTEGADRIIQGNRHFESGRAQIFKLVDCTHFMNTDKPQELAQLCIDFFEGNVSGKFELKPTLEFAFE